MYIQAIEVLRGKRRQGHFNKLLQEIWSLGFTIKVPNPYRNMFNILNKKGFEQTEGKYSVNDKNGVPAKTSAPQTIFRGT